MNWQFAEAEDRLDEILTLAIEEGPQFITRGTEEAVAISRDAYLKLVNRRTSSFTHRLNSPATDTSDHTHD
jgi:hypothetical protein